MKIKTISVLSLFAAILMLISPGAAQTSTQSAAQSEPQTELDERGTIKAEEMVNSRPSGGTPNAKSYIYRRRTQTKASPQSTKTRKDASANQSSPSAKGKAYVSIGVTLGRGRPATEAETKDSSIAKAQKCLERQEGKCVRSQEIVLERISENTPIAHGTLIQMMIEYLAAKDKAGKILDSSRLGYLYVINRVEFKNKPANAPTSKLIFPTKSTFGGDNRVLPGKTVVLPEPEHLWQITRNKIATQEFETYIIIISPEPLKDLSGKELIGNNLGDGTTPLELSDALINSWVGQWGGGEIQLELEQSAGQLFTQREQAAGGNPRETSRDTEEIDTDLKQSDPPPQLGFSKAIAPNGKMLVTIKFPFRDSTASATPEPKAGHKSVN